MQGPDFEIRLTAFARESDGTRTLSHDAFARTELHRKAVPVTLEVCDWCGGLRQLKSGKVYLYRYSTSRDDGGRASAHKGLFCSKSCHDAYHG